MSSSGAPVQPFTDAFGVFLNRLQPYNTAQRREIYNLMVRNFQETLQAFPVARQESSAPAAAAASSSAGAASGAAAKSDPRAHLQLADLEWNIAEKLHQQGHSRTIFTRFDPLVTGRVLPKEFKAAIASIGLILSDAELQLFVAKYAVDDKGNIAYDDFIKYVHAKRDAQPRPASRDHFSATGVGRTPAVGHEVSALVRTIEIPLEARFAKGLKQLRETLYFKGVTFNALFAQLQNDNMTIAVDDVVPQLNKMGFPEGLVSTEQLKELANQYAIKTPGYFDYYEFQAFLMGRPAKSDDAKRPSMGADQPALIACLVTVNNHNLHKFFKNLDSNYDGVISTSELCKGLNDFGLSSAVTNNGEFVKYVESFCKKKPGYLQYGEFLRFVSTRPGGQNTKVAGEPVIRRSPIKIASSATPAQVMELLNAETRDESLLTYFEHFDPNTTGFVNESDFFLCLHEMGFLIPPANCKALFDALSEGGQLGIHDFCRWVANPSRMTKLKVAGARPTAGGESSVPLGSSQHDIVPVQLVDSRAHTGRNVSEQTFDFKAGPLPESKTPRVDRNTRNTSGLFGAEHLDGKLESVRGRGPVGGATTLDFARDHGAVLTIGKGGPVGGAQTYYFSNDGPGASPRSSRKIVQPPGGEVSFKIGFPDFDAYVDDEPPRPASPRKPVGGVSTISMKQTDKPDEFKPQMRILSVPGGPSNMDLSFDPKQAPPSPTKTGKMHIPPKPATIELDFHPETNTELHQASLRQHWAQQAPGGNSTLSLAHSNIVSQAEIDKNATPLTPGARRGKSTHQAPGGNASLLSFGSEASKAILAQFDNEPKPSVDWALLKKVTEAVHGRGARTRHTFQNFSKNGASLSKAGFQAGLESIGCSITTDQVNHLYERFDGDLDGDLTYTEFVRLLNTYTAEVTKPGSAGGGGGASAPSSPAAVHHAGAGAGAAAAASESAASS